MLFKTLGGLLFVASSCFAVTSKISKETDVYTVSIFLRDNEEYVFKKVPLDSQEQADDFIRRAEELEKFLDSPESTANALHLMMGFTRKHGYPFSRRLDALLWTLPLHLSIVGEKKGFIEVTDVTHPKYSRKEFFEKFFKDLVLIVQIAEIDYGISSEEIQPILTKALTPRPPVAPLTRFQRIKRSCVSGFNWFMGNE